MTHPTPARWAIAIGAGLASALLFAVSAKGSMLAMLLAYFAPLPLMVAAMGWGATAGLAGALSGTAALALGVDLRLGVAFALGVALPGWWLANLALLARTEGGHVAWYPLGRLGAWAAGLAVASALLAVASVAWSAGGGEAAADALARRLAPIVDAMAGGPGRLPQGIDALDFARLAVRMLPAAMAGSALFMLVANLWVSAKVCAVSGRLARPWPDIAAEFVLPRPLLVALGLGVLGLVAGGAVALVGTVIAAACLCAYALQGLAFVHARSRGWTARRPLLAGLYLAIVLLMPWPLALLAALGVADAALRLPGRSRPTGS